MPLCSSASVRKVHITHEFNSSRERVFGALDDHANMGRWLGSAVTIVKNVDGGGVGTVRRIDAGLAKLDEEIVEREAPSRLVYRIIAGLPFLRHHRGVITVDAVGDARSVVRWDVELEMKIPGLSSLLAKAIASALKRGLARLDRHLERMPERELDPQPAS